MWKSLILKLAKKTVIMAAIGILRDKKHEIITVINSRIDIPGKTEKEEEQIYKTIYDIVLSIVRDL